MTIDIDPDQQWWYNLATGEVEQGMQSASYDRVGPFATKTEAVNAPATLAENSRKWSDDEADR